MKKLSFLFALILSIALFQSCQKDAEIDPYAGQDAPQLPTEETFVMSLTPFTELDGLTDPNEIDDRTVNNWGHAAANGPKHRR